MKETDSTDITKDHETAMNNYMPKIGQPIRNGYIPRNNLPRLNHDELENLNKSITTMEIESASKNLPTNKIPEPDSLIAEFYQTFKEINITYSQTLPKNRRELFQTHFMRPALP